MFARKQLHAVKFIYDTMIVLDFNLYGRTPTKIFSTGSKDISSKRYMTWEKIAEKHTSKYKNLTKNNQI